MRNAIFLACALVLMFLAPSAEARRRHRRHYNGPPPTHPVVLWARTLSQSDDREQRRVAACKLAHYSQPIFQSSVVEAIVKGMKDSDFEIKVCCAKAMGRAGNARDSENIRHYMLERYKADPELRSTLIRAFIVRRDRTPAIHDMVLDALAKSNDVDEQLVLLNYLENYGDGGNRFVDTLAELFKKTSHTKVKRAAATALGDRSRGQNTAVGILADCVDSKETPLVLACLDGLRQQAKKDARAWEAVEKTLRSGDGDVVTASLDIIPALGEISSPNLTKRLLTIVEDTEDATIEEKAVNALGVCGDGSEKLVSVMAKLLEEEDGEEMVRISAALVLGRQSTAFSERPQGLLSKCAKDSKSTSLRNACQLGLSDLEARVKIASQPSALIGTPPPIPPGTPQAVSSSEKVVAPAKVKETVKRHPKGEGETEEETEGEGG